MDAQPSIEPGAAPTPAETTTESTHSTSPLTEPQKRTLVEKMKNLKKTKHSIYFTKPVDTVTLNLTTYLDIIKKPMDLGTMEQKLKNNQYRSVKDFVDDFNLIINNTRTFNGDAHLVTQAGMSMQAYFNKMMESVPGPNHLMAAKSSNSKRS
ncbi:transcription initiation at TATA-containing promoter protein, partial [Teratosphaeriaceae sp. CCFEE 6253]